MKKTASASGFFLSIILGILSIPQSVFSWPIPDTGQTKCYNNTGEITCPQPGEAFYGQDGNYNINPPSYTKLDASGNALSEAATTWAMIRDNVTGLIWENKTTDGTIHDGSKTFTWCDKNPTTNGGNQGTCGTGIGDAATDTEAFIKALNDANFGGTSDWRLPTYLELKTIVNSGRYNPTINEAYFPETRQSYYWSSSSIAADPTAASYIDFELGSDNKDSPSGVKNNAYFVRAVRGVKLDSQGSLINNFDGTITDIRTGLMWQQFADANISNWQNALSYTENLTLSGYDDWRMPTQTEMHSIVVRTRYNPAAYINEFPDTLSHSAYRTSTSSVKWPDFVGGVHFFHGSDYGSKKNRPEFKTCCTRWPECSPRTPGYSLSETGG